jgi:hypothetical protein
MVNKIFESAIRAEDAGVSLEKAVERSILKAIKEVGFIFGPESIW